jgi:hypothetical protein
VAQPIGGLHRCHAFQGPWTQGAAGAHLEH